MRKNISIKKILLLSFIILSAFAMTSCVPKPIVNEINKFISNNKDSSSINYEESSLTAIDLQGEWVSSDGSIFSFEEIDLNWYQDDLNRENVQKGFFTTTTLEYSSAYVHNPEKYISKEELNSTVIEFFIEEIHYNGEVYSVGEIEDNITSFLVLEQNGNSLEILNLKTLNQYTITKR